MIPLNLTLYVLVTFCLCNAQTSNKSDVDFAEHNTYLNNSEVGLRIVSTSAKGGNSSPVFLGPRQNLSIRRAIVTKTSSTSLIYDLDDPGVGKQRISLKEWLTPPRNIGDPTAAKPSKWVLSPEKFEDPTDEIQNNLKPWITRAETIGDPMAKKPINYFNQVLTNPWSMGELSAGTQGNPYNKRPASPEKWKPQFINIIPPNMPITEHPIYGPTDFNLLLNHLWVSGILRDNIVTTFGSILYRPMSELPEPLYTALYILYDYIRLRRIQTTDYISILKTIQNLTPQQQFLYLFVELRKRLPRHLGSNAEIWAQALASNRLDVNDIMRSNGELPEFDLLASFHPSHLTHVDVPVTFPESIVKQASENLMQQMGPLFACVFSGLQQGTINLTQPLFAVTLLHRPLDTIVPQLDEVERFMIDILRSNGIKNWPEINHKLDLEDFTSPFMLIPRVLGLIAQNPNEKEQVRRDASEMLPYINPPTDTFTNQFYQTMSPVVGSPQINYKTLFEQINSAQFGQDVIRLVNMFQKYIDLKYIDMDLSTKGFIRHDYKTPVDVLIAILTRIIQRQQFFDEDIKATIKALQQALIFRNHRCSMQLYIPNRMISIPTIVEGMTSLAFPQEVNIMGNMFLPLIKSKEIFLKNLTLNSPISNCSTPKECLVTVLTVEIVNGTLSNISSVPIIEELINTVDDISQMPKTVECPEVANEPSDYQVAVEHEVLYQTTTTDRIEPTTITTEPNLSLIDTTTGGLMLLETTTTIPTTETEATAEVHTTIDADVNFPPFSANMFVSPLPFNQRENLLPLPQPYTPKDNLIKPIRAFILRPDLLEILGPDFDPEMYSNRASLLRAILEKALTLPFIKSNIVLYGQIDKYLTSLVKERNKLCKTSGSLAPRDN